MPYVLVKPVTGINYELVDKLTILDLSLPATPADLDYNEREEEMGLLRKIMKRWKIAKVLWLGAPKGQRQKQRNKVKWVGFP